LEHYAGRKTRRLCALLLWTSLREFDSRLKRATMTVDEIRSIFEQNPKQSFRLMLACGNVVDVESPALTLIEDSLLYIARDKVADVKRSQKLSVVSIPHVTMVQKSYRPSML
jgi:hypothetical protein